MGDAGADDRLKDGVGATRSLSHSRRLSGCRLEWYRTVSLLVSIFGIGEGRAGRVAIHAPARYALAMATPTAAAARPSTHVLPT
jgi:hypothetical protein